MKIIDNLMWRIHRRIRFPDGSFGHIICAENETTRPYSNYSQDGYSIHQLVAGQGQYSDAAGNITELTEGIIFQRQQHCYHSTSVTQQHGPWYERFFFMTENLATRLKALGFLPLHPAVLDPACASIFNETFQTICDSIRHYDINPRYDNDVLMVLINACRQLATKTASGQAVADSDAGIITRACSLLNEDLRAEWNLPDIATELGINYNTLRKRFVAIQGCSLQEYRIQRRIEQVKRLLEDGMPVHAVATELFYSSPFALSNQFRRFTGMSPRTFLKSINIPPNITKQ